MAVTPFQIAMGAGIFIGIVSTIIGATMLLANRHYEPWKAKQEFFLIATFLVIAGFFYCVLTAAVFDF